VDPLAVGGQFARVPRSGGWRRLCGMDPCLALRQVADAIADE
jgi:hypothetical protein